MLRLPRKSLTIAPEVMATRGDIVLEHLGGWSNTGYLHLSICRDDAPNSRGAQNVSKSEPSDRTSDHTATISKSDPLISETSAASLTVRSKYSATGPDATPDGSTPKILNGYSTKILAIDDKQHLIGLKRQRGGIGRSAHDESQKKLDGFFKKQRTT